MKSFKSTKNLRQVQNPNKEQSLLRMKVKNLQQQVQSLQKSNLNIFIPISQHQQKNTPNYQSIINKLKTQILQLQQDLLKQKNIQKKLQSQKQMMKINHQNQINQMNERMKQLNDKNKQLQSQIDQIQQRLQISQQKRKQMQKQNIQLKVENKFLKQDMNLLKQRIKSIQNKYNELHVKVLAVNFHSKIYRACNQKITAIETQQLTKLKDYIELLQNRIKEMTKSKQVININCRSKNIGEQIVKLKKNIDLQLGLEVCDKTTKSFLEKYNKTNEKFQQLLTSCKNH